MPEELTAVEIVATAELRSAGQARASVPTRSEPNFDHELPIQIPTINTSTPPTTTWNAAESRGVSM